MNEIEEKLWSYVDGTCSEEERKVIGKLLTENEVYQKKYAEIQAFNQELLATELDEPSMGFTYKVMETIRTEYAQQPLKAKIDKRIIRGISGFFIFTILAILIYAISTVHWTANQSTLNISANVIKETKVFFTGSALKAFLFFDVVLGLFLFDAYLRKRSVFKQMK